MAGLLDREVPGLDQCALGLTGLRAWRALVLQMAALSEPQSGEPRKLVLPGGGSVTPARLRCAGTASLPGHPRSWAWVALATPGSPEVCHVPVAEDEAKKGERDNY